MAELIQVTPEVLRSKANEIKGYRTQHDEVISKVKGLVNSLPDSFKGEAATAFVNKFGEMESTFTNFSELLGSFATKLEENARVLEEADRMAAQANSK